MWNNRCIFTFIKKRKCSADLRIFPQWVRMSWIPGKSASAAVNTLYTYSLIDRLGDVKIDEVQISDGLRQLTQQEDNDHDDEHHLQLQRQVTYIGELITHVIMIPVRTQQQHDTCPRDAVYEHTMCYMVWRAIRFYIHATGYFQHQFIMFTFILFVEDWITLNSFAFYRAKRSVARYCHDKLSVRPSVCL